MYCNLSEPAQYYFQNGATNIHLDIIYLHDYIQFYLLVMILIITWVYLFIIHRFIVYYTPLIDLIHGSTLEIIWTLVPAIILILIAIPGFTVLYTLDQTVNSEITLKAIGSQWYWTYQISDYSFANFLESSYDSYMVPVDQLSPGDLRLLEVDNTIILPANKLVRIVVTSTDVIHSFSIPSLGIKVDALPGRLNQTSINLTRYGHFYGSCQEICGIQHSFMPIKLISTDYGTFLNWMISKSI